MSEAARRALASASSARRAARACSRWPVARVGPRLQAARATLDTAFVNAGASATNAQAPAADIATFWRGFNDPALSTTLIERALPANGDVRIAQARLQEARATLQRRRRRTSLPNVGVGARGDALAWRPRCSFPARRRSQRTGTRLRRRLHANWELDLFGRNRRASESAAAQVDALARPACSAAHTERRRRGGAQLPRAARTAAAPARSRAQSLVNQRERCA